MVDPTPNNDLSERDLAVLRYVARFRQLTAMQIRQLVFPDTSSTPSDRSLRRLVARQYLRRIERRLVGGARGGSGMYVYELGRRGFYRFFEGRYNPSRNVNHHALAIADCYLALVDLERQGRLYLSGVATEPDCWAVVGGVELRPDLRVDVVLPDRRTVLNWIEVDLATESQKQLRGKLEAYYRAWNEADAGAWPVFPRCVWVVIDVERARELRWLVSQLPEQARPLFAVATLADLPSVIC